MGHILKKRFWTKLTDLIQGLSVTIPTMSRSSVVQDANVSVNGDDVIDVVAGAGPTVVKRPKGRVVSRANKTLTVSTTDPKSPGSTTGHSRQYLTGNRHNIINVLQK